MLTAMTRIPRMRVLACLITLACLTPACASERGDEPQQPAASNEKATTASPTKAPEGAPPSFEGTSVRVSDGPLPFTLDLADSGMSGSRVGDGDYVTLSGPLGGPLMLRIYPATVSA